MRVLRRLAPAALAAAVLAQAPARAEIPVIGGELRKIGDKEEVRLGGGLASIILGAAPLLNDPARQRHINRLGKWIALHSERPQLPWTFGIVDTPDVNAFSMPGGYVLVTRGMVERMRNESELAGVLAHEIAHVDKRHHLGVMHLTAGLLVNQAGNALDKLPVQGLRRKLGSGVLGKAQHHLDPGGEGAAGQLTQAALEAGRDLFTRGLAREDEFEADRIAVVLAVRSGFSPFGLAGVLQTLSASEADGVFALHTRTHPSATDRLTRLDEAIGAQFDELSGLAVDTPGFAALRRPADQLRKAGRRP